MKTPVAFPGDREMEILREDDFQKASAGNAHAGGPAMDALQLLLDQCKKNSLIIIEAVAMDGVVRDYHP